MKVIVDMREFMNSLRNVLHQKGMRMILVTLEIEIGDYILTPLNCLERKNIQDLFMNFTSSRLYHQVETMMRHFRIPVLLIEFSQDKNFSFQSATAIGDDVTPNSIISKLSLLALHFPRLRIILSLHATAEIFASLKENPDEPDETKAMRVGVTDSHYRAIMDGCKSLAELALLPVEMSAELMGGQMGNVFMSQAGHQEPTFHSLIKEQMKLCTDRNKKGPVSDLTGIAERVLMQLFEIDEENIFGAPEYTLIFFKKLITLAMNGKNREKEMVSTLLSVLHIEFSSMEDTINGFVMLLEILEDATLDIWNASSELAFFLVRAVIDDILVSLNLDCRLPHKCNRSETVQRARSFEAGLTNSL